MVRVHFARIHRGGPLYSTVKAKLDLREIVKYGLIFYTFRPIWIKFSAGIICVSLLGSCEFHENRLVKTDVT